MKRRRTPQEKKALVYDKDHVMVTEFPHVFRNTWPRMKAHANRAYRRKTHQLIADVLHTTDDEYQDELSPSPIRRAKVRKWNPPVSMRDWVKSRLRLRIEATTAPFLLSEYHAQHRERFAEFLNAQMRNKDAYAREAAAFFSELLELSAPYVPPRSILSNTGWHDDEYRRNERRARLRQFYNDEPDMERRVREWIAQTLD